MEYNNQEQYNQSTNNVQYNQIINELEEIKKNNKSHNLIIMILLIVVLILIVFSTYTYIKLNNVNNSENPSGISENNEVNSGQNTEIKKEVTANYCYKNRLVGKSGKSEACLKEESCNEVTETAYDKQVIRLSGDTEGVKKFNVKLETLVNDYAWDNYTKQYMDYTCNPITESNLLTGVTFKYSNEIYQLGDKYIVIRINIDHENLDYAGAYNGVYEIFVFDIEKDKEITKKEFIQTLKNKYNISLALYCGDPSSDNYKLRDNNNNDINASDLASKINGAFNTSYNGEKLTNLFFDMYLTPFSKDYIYKPYYRVDNIIDKNDEFYKMYFESRCSEQEFM